MKYPAALVAIFFTLTLAASAIVADQPNFILINIDDLGYGDIGPFGSTKNKTPNLDQMAAEGRLLKSHYAAPVCSPSRASLMTGCYPKRAMPIRHVLFPCSAVGLRPNEITIAEILKQQGYATGCIGKWHLGDQKEFLPTRQGFDYYFGLPYSNDMGLPEDGARSNAGKPLPKPRDKNKAVPLPPDGYRGNFQPALPLMENEKVIERVTGELQTRLTKQYTEKAVEFIANNKDKPFFLYLPHSGPGSRLVGRRSPQSGPRFRYRRKDTGHLHFGQRWSSAARSQQRTASRRQGIDVGRRRARADGLLVARQNQGRHFDQRHHQHDGYPSHICPTGRCESP